MTGQETAIVTLFEEAGLEPAEIAEQLSLETESVKFCLSVHSKLFRSQAFKPNGNNQNKGSSLDTSVFSEEEFKNAAQTLSSLVYSDDDHVRFRASKFVLDESKGRHATKSNIGKVNINIAVFNDQLKRAREAKEKAKGTVVDVQIVSPHQLST